MDGSLPFWLNHGVDFVVVNWEKPKPEKIALFLNLVPQDPRVQPRQMFGYPCAFVNGNMFCGMHGQKFIVRLPEARRAALTKAGWAVFSPMPGRFMKEYLVIPEKMLAKPKEASNVFWESLEYAAALPKKEKKSKKAQ